MSPKPDGSFEVAQPDRWVPRSLARVGVQFGQAVTGALSERLDALEERLNTGAIPKSGGAAHGRMRDLLHQDRALLAVRDSAARKERSEREENDEDHDEREPSEVLPKRASSRGAAQGRMRELLQRDRAMLAGQDDWDDDVAPPKKEASVPGPQPMAAVVTAPVIHLAAAQPVAAAEPKPSMPKLAADAGEDDAPIRTRTMARLLALQGHKDQALAIYDELIKRDSWDNGLIEEAERLRR